MKTIRIMQLVKLKFLMIIIKKFIIYQKYCLILKLQAHY